ncbi:MAG: hypothetical protein Q4B85_13595 [Lachnospiraceae bacterium]|nr:hypothetical protein [Lachnospiraceae bacterium]
MSEAILVDALEQLKPFLNDNKVLEIVVRGKNKRIAAFQKVLLNDIPQVQEKAAIEKAVNLLNRNTLLNERNLKLVSEVAKIQKIGLLLNGLNLCATCAGFAIMYEKLDKMSAEIGQQIYQLHNTVKQGNDVQSGYEFNKVLADHTDMLDCRKKKQPYPEGKMRELVDREYNVLMLLIDIFQKDIAADKEKVVFSIFSMLSMFTVALRYFDELYYTNNHEVLGNENVWHSSHNKWMGAYSTLLSQPFVEKLQDYAVFDAKLNTLGVDAYYISLMDQVVEQKEEVEDNQELIISLGDSTLLEALRDMTDMDIKKTISDAFSEACGDNSSPEVKKVYEDAMKQVGMA